VTYTRQRQFVKVGRERKHQAANKTHCDMIEVKIIARDAQVEHHLKIKTTSYADINSITSILRAV
jgi:hypothetical protein